jgi:hypothetical protein
MVSCSQVLDPNRLVLYFGFAVAPRENYAPEVGYLRRADTDSERLILAIEHIERIRESVSNFVKPGIPNHVQPPRSTPKSHEDMGTLRLTRKGAHGADREP